MPDSIRQQIINKIDERLKTIQIINGYETDAGKNVFHYKENPFEQANLPCIEYRDISDSPEYLSFGLFLHVIMLEIRAYANGVNVDKTIRKIRADIEKAIGTDLTWDGLAEDTRQINISQDIDLEHKEKKNAGILFPIAIEYVSEGWSPY